MKERKQRRMHKKVTRKWRGNKEELGRRRTPKQKNATKKNWAKMKRKEGKKHKMNGRLCAGKLGKTDTTRTSWPYTWHTIDKTSFRNKCAKHETRSDERFCSHRVSKMRAWIGGSWSAENNIGSSFHVNDD